MTRENIPREFKSLPPEIEKEIEIKIKSAVENTEFFVWWCLFLLVILAFLLSIFFVEPKLKGLVFWIGERNTAMVAWLVSFILVFELYLVFHHFWRFLIKKIKKDKKN